jgi:kynurenine 3-monooxygenase
MSRPSDLGDIDVAIVGAGLAGSLLACFLGRRGLRVRVFERRSDPRRGPAERGRSINLAISERGLDALRRIGLEGAAMADALPMRGRMIHPVDGPLDFQPYSARGDLAINSIGRGALNAALLDAAEAAPGVDVVFDHRLVGLRVDPDGAAVRASFEAGRNVSAPVPVVIGADGAGSAVRGELLAMGAVDERLEFLGHGYKELHIPARDGDFALDPGALHIWPRGSSMMIALPNPDRSFTCTLFWPNGGDQCFAALSSPAAIERHFRRHYPDVVALMPTLVEDYQHNPVGLLGTVFTEPWHAGGRIGLLGDAAHAIVPFYGQGANCAFEDVVELDRCLTDTGGDWARALPLLDRRRRQHTDAIAAMALENFVEMRDKVASPVYRATKRVEHALERALPGRYVSRYELVSFSNVPYADVRRRVRRQRAAVAGALSVAAVATGAGAVAGVARWRDG